MGSYRWLPVVQANVGRLDDKDVSIQVLMNVRRGLTKSAKLDRAASTVNRSPDVLVLKWLLDGGADGFTADLSPVEFERRYAQPAPECLRKAGRSTIDIQLQAVARVMAASIHR
jgi:hypothetical protein